MIKARLRAGKGRVDIGTSPRLQTPPPDPAIALNSKVCRSTGGAKGSISFGCGRTAICPMLSQLSMFEPYFQVIGVVFVILKIWKVCRVY